jgi:nucleotide-binding universal stress UspA family protein
MVMTDSPASPLLPTRKPFIVVGVDGSDECEAALEWAIHQAELTGAAVQVVAAWHVPAMAYGSGATLSVDLGLEEATRAVSDRARRYVETRAPSVSVSTSVVRDAAAPALIAAAETAELLVVGSRGHGEMAGMLLGSVSEHCVSHAACPVVVVRRRARTTSSAA